MRKLYHGSIYDFAQIDVSAGRGYKDFGRGFYATANAGHAEGLAKRNKAIAERRQEILKNRGVRGLVPVTAYRYNLIFSEDIDGLSIKTFSFADSEWLKFIIENRKCSECAHEFDIVVGPTADAETTAIINEYFDELMESNFSEDLCKAVISELSPENLPKQYFFRTEAAIKTLKFDKIKRQVIM